VAVQRTRVLDATAGDPAARAGSGPRPDTAAGACRATADQVTLRTGPVPDAPQTAAPEAEAAAVGGRRTTVAGRTGMTAAAAPAAAPPRTDPDQTAPDQSEPPARTRRSMRKTMWSASGQCHSGYVRIELMHRAFGFAALGVVTLVPLLIVIAAAAPVDGHTFATWIIAGLGLSGSSAHAVQHLFGPPGRVLSTTTGLSLGVLAVFGLSFAAAVQTGLERVWELNPSRWFSVWRRVVWLAVLVGYLLVTADLVELMHGAWYWTTLQGCITTIGTSVFFWWTARFLLDGRVGWRPLLPGAVLTVVGLVGLRFFSVLIFSPLIVSSAITYGAIGTVLIVVSWLIGIGFVVFGGALAGRALYEAWTGHEADRIGADGTCQDDEDAVLAARRGLTRRGRAQLRAAARKAAGKQSTWSATLQAAPVRTARDDRAHDQRAHDDLAQGEPAPDDAARQDDPE
jgi:membrane protein